MCDVKTNDKINDKIKALDDLIVSLLKEDKYSTLTELAAKTSKSTITIHRHLENLASKGRVSRVGSRKNGYWDVRN